MQTIQEAKDHLNKNYEEGCNCPCCGQFVKEYKRVLNAGMVRALILIANAHTHHPLGWVDVKQIDVRGGDYAKLRFWGLIEKHDAVEGLWRATQLGFQFVHDKARVPRYAHVLLGECRALRGRDIGVREALANKFNYQQLMSS